MTASVKIDFDNMTPEEFERQLPELFASAKGKLSEDPRFKDLFAQYPDRVALVRELEAIAEAARSLLAPVEDPSDQVWTNIQNKLRAETGALNLDEKDEDENDGGLLPNGGAATG